MGNFFSDTWAMERTGKHRTTIMRWRRTRGWPPELVRLARLEIDGELGLIDRRWDGFRLCYKRGVLITRYPQEYDYTPGELLSLPWRLGQLRALELARRQWREAANARRFAQAVLVCPHCGADARSA